MREIKKLGISCVLSLFLLLFFCAPVYAGSCKCLQTSDTGSEEMCYEEKNSASDCPSGTLGNLTIASCNFFSGANCQTASTETTPAVTDVTEDLQINKPILEINIPQLQLSDVGAELDEEGYMHLPWIGEYLSAIYKFGLIAISIVAVVLIILTGAKIIVSDEKEKNEGLKRVGQIVIGLFIAWGSYAILYNINPDLVTFKPLKVRYIPRTSFDQLIFDKGNENESFATSNLSPSELDGLFRSYASCYGMDWKILKVIAQTESNLNPNVVNRFGFQGLFQMKRAYCEGSMEIEPRLQSSGLNINCENLLDPETNTALAAAGINHDLGRIINKCGQNINGADAVRLIYIGHNNGAGVLRSILNRVTSGQCQGNNIRAIVEQVYRSGEFHSNITVEEALRRFDNAITRTAQRAQSAGISNVYPNGPDTNTCPLSTGRRYAGITNNITTNNILAIGDSITADSSSYARVLTIPESNIKAQVGRKVDIPGEGSCPGETCDMRASIKNLNLSGFTSVIVLGGINDLASVKNAQTVINRLTSLYNDIKNKNNNIKIIGITIPPWGNWTGNSDAANLQDETQTINNWIKSNADIAVDFYSLILEPNSAPPAQQQRYKGDGLHPNSAAHQVLANEIRQRAFPNQ
ncbi:MAG: GDSL-type esterase/lipase family protein [Patescibacteria group bacterium]|nr:GDSL-type esterase/lipase family protein [Patescibacteria group bacterium]